MSGHDDPRAGSGRGGSLGAPGMGDPPEELHPERDRPEEEGQEGSFVVSGGGVADPAQEEPGAEG